jgi:exopolysaccharide production protein ExoQ
MAVPAAAANAWASPAAATRTEALVLGVLLCVFCALPFLLGDQPAFLTSVKETGITSPQGDSSKQLVLLAIYGLTGAVLLPRLTPQVRSAIGWPLVLLLAWAGLSAAWSDMAGITMRRTVALSGTLMLGTYMALRWSPRDLARLLVHVAVVVLGASFLVALVLPASGLDPEHRLRGVFAHKNTLAAFAALALICAADGLAGQDRRDRRPAVLAALLGVAALAFAASASPVPAVAVAAFSIFQIRRKPTGARHGLPIRLCGAIFAAVILLPWLAPYVGEVALLFGRNADFSGRTLVWRFAIEFFQRHPLLGYGFGAFWQGPAGLLFVNYAHFPVAHTHNGVMQLLLECGVVGLALFTAVLVRALRGLASILDTMDRHANAWLAGFMVLYTIANLTETHLLEPNDLYTVLFAYVVVRTKLTCAAYSSPESCIHQK